MGKPRAVGPADEARFRRQWAEGVTLRALSAEYGCGLDTVSQTAKRLGLEPRRAVPGREYALVGGSWVPDERGVSRWVPS